MQTDLKRKATGSAVAEAGASLTILLPITLLIAFMILEASYAYLIKSCLSQAACMAARDLSIAYGQNPSVSTSRSLQDAVVFDNIRITKIIAASPQFDNPIFDTASNPPTVSVTVRYLSGQYGLPTFPNPDPLMLGTSFVITASSEYRLE